MNTSSYAERLKKRKVIFPTALKLAAVSVIYYVLRTQALLSGSFLLFLFQDVVGYIIVFGLHWFFIFRGIRRYFKDDPGNTKIRTGIFIGFVSSVIGRIISSLFLFWLVNYFDLAVKDTINVYSPFALIIAVFYAAITGLLFGAVSGFILKLQYR